MTNLIPHTINASVINQRSSDGFISATAMCNAADKLLADYRRLSSTNEYLHALSSDMGNPITDLIQIKRGGRPSEQGTWVHPKVALHLAQWLSPEFAVQVTNWVYDWMTGQSPISVRAHTRKKPVKKPEHTKTPIERWDEAQAQHKPRLVEFSVNGRETGRAVKEASLLFHQGVEAHFGNMDNIAAMHLMEANNILMNALKGLEGKALVKWS
jgi:hypothetical protein